MHQETSSQQQTAKLLKTLSELSERDEMIRHLQQQVDSLH